MNTNILISIFASGTDSESRLVGLADVVGMMRGTCQLPPIVTAKLHGGDSLATLTARYRAALAEALDSNGGDADKAKHNSRFEAPSLEQELLDKHYRLPSASETGEFVTVAEALQAIGYGIVQKLNPVLAGKAFSTLGFRAKRNSHSRGYIAVRRTEDEIKARRTLMVHEAEAEDESTAGV